MQQARWMARARKGPQALGARQALEMATLGGARLLGREAELGSLTVGKLADIALWRVDGFGHDVIDDPVVGLVLGGGGPLERRWVGWQGVVERGELRTLPVETASARGRAAHRKLLQEVNRCWWSRPVCGIWSVQIGTELERTRAERNEVRR